MILPSMMFDICPMTNDDYKKSILCSYHQSDFTTFDTPINNDNFKRLCKEWFLKTMEYEYFANIGCEKQQEEKERFPDKILILVYVEDKV